jgi:hypothetical protein
MRLSYKTAARLTALRKRALAAAAALRSESDSFMIGKEMPLRARGRPLWRAAERAAIKAERA